ncbi:hypothetical protein GL2_34150 [Microbulbifer sp. GL-2]|nr:hypothetical protein GL2_34150 [Microbulbifer sp. GL-2]
MTKRFISSVFLLMALVGCAHQEDTLNNELWPGDLNMYQLSYSNEPQPVTTKSLYTQPEDNENKNKQNLISDSINWHIRAGYLTFILR